MSMLSHADLMAVRLAPPGATVTFTCKHFDEVCPHGLVDELDGLAAENGVTDLTLDMAAVEYLSSGVLGMMIVLDRRLRDRGGRLRVVNCAPAVYEVFHAARLDDLLDVHQKGQPARTP